MGTKLLAVGCIAMFLASCSGTPSARVKPVKPEDKQLACADIEIEMHEAEYLRKKAIENKGFGFGDVIAPLSYASTRSNANDAIEASDERISYLQRIYEIRGCDRPEVRDAQLMPQPPMQPAAMPQQGYQQPVMQQQGYAPQPYYGYARPAPANYGLDYQPKPGYPQKPSSWQPVSAGEDEGYYHY